MRLVNPTPTELEAIRNRLRLEDRHRLRPDGLMNPALPPLHLCGGLEAPYLVLPSFEPSASPPTLSEQVPPPSSAEK